MEGDTHYTHSCFLQLQLQDDDADGDDDETKKQWIINPGIVLSDRKDGST